MQLHDHLAFEPEHISLKKTQKKPKKQVNNDTMNKYEIQDNHIHHDEHQSSGPAR